MVKLSGLHSIHIKIHQFKVSIILVVLFFFSSSPLKPFENDHDHVTITSVVMLELHAKLFGRWFAPFKNTCKHVYFPEIGCIRETWRQWVLVFLTWSMFYPCTTCLCIAYIILANTSIQTVSQVFDSRKQTKRMKFQPYMAKSVLIKYNPVAWYVCVISEPVSSDVALTVIPENLETENKNTYVIESLIVRKTVSCFPAQKCTHIWWRKIPQIPTIRFLLFLVILKIVGIILINIVNAT